MLDRSVALARACRSNRILAVYLFGSRADCGLQLLRGERVDPAGSDLDVGVAFDGDVPAGKLGAIQADFAEVFAPLHVDLVPIQHVDALFSFRAIDGHRVFEADSTIVAFFELGVMRRAAELLPIQRRHERDTFGVSTT